MFRFNFGKRFSIHFPWSSGLGTLGLKLGDKYGDITIENKRLRLFTSMPQVIDQIPCTIRSWYRLTLNGWELLKREDYFGTWQNGKRRPPLYDLPDDGTTVTRALALRPYFKPYQIIDWYGRHLEVISYPSPESLCVSVMLREPGDPTTMFEEVLEQFLPEYGPNAA